MSEACNPTMRTVDFIREIGIYRLCPSEGCPCTRFSVHNVDVEVSCHKSGHSVTVSSGSLDYYGDLEKMLRPIADEVLRQVDAYYDAGGEYAAGFKVIIREAGPLP